MVQFGGPIWGPKMTHFGVVSTYKHFVNTRAILFEARISGVFSPRRGPIRAPRITRMGPNTGLWGSRDIRYSRYFRSSLDEQIPRVWPNPRSKVTQKGSKGTPKGPILARHARRLFIMERGLRVPYFGPFQDPIWEDMGSRCTCTAL